MKYVTLCSEKRNCGESLANVITALSLTEKLHKIKTKILVPEIMQKPDKKLSLHVTRRLIGLDITIGDIETASYSLSRSKLSRSLPGRKINSSKNILRT